ncbi:MAG: 1-deoxy-D-xylulose-5-phosphate synthase N-terminal domain-containing protein [Thermomicrobiales bacterium]
MASIIERRTGAGSGTVGTSGPDDETIALLEAIQWRVLWLSTNIIDHANHVRPNPEKTKVGGHQASSASVVSILTALYFHHLNGRDRVAIKPHASPAYHAVQYLLGLLDRAYLTTLRGFHGLQSYPSRTKDPDRVDFSTGSVGLGAVAPLFAALTERYASTHFGASPRRRFIALVGDAELDEGNVWEAVAEEAVRGLGNVLWIVDLNRQSLDRIVPGIRAAQLERLFDASGWRVLEAKYGRRLQAAFARPGGAALRRRIDDMSNEEYQALIRLPGAPLRERLLVGADPDRADLAAALEPTSDDELPALIADLGGHDLHELLAKFAEADADPDRPTVLFAYTIKGWGLPIAGEALNHSALLTSEQLTALRDHLGIEPGAEWDAFPPDSPEGQLCAARAAVLRDDPLPALALTPEQVPEEINFRPGQAMSTQEAFGAILAQLARDPVVGPRVVTTSPDVAVSTNLGAWINRAGVFAPDAAPDYTEGAARLLRWQPGPEGQHIELGISEMNLFMLLGQLGLSVEHNGRLLLPVGTVYDPFVCRGLDALIHGVYSGSKFIVAGTPSGISLSPEGGAHQSTITPSIGLELPNLTTFEPAFAREVEWCLLDGFRRCCDRIIGDATYLRLSTKPIAQQLLQPALDRLGADELRRQVLAGGYRLVEPPATLAGAPRVVIATAGAMIPEAAEATVRLHDEGIAAVLLNITSADRLYRGLVAARRAHVRDATVGPAAGHLATLLPPNERRTPIVTVLDGASHALAFLGMAFGAPVVPLGVDHFGQVGTRAELYREELIDAESIVNAALLALDLDEDDKTR